MKEPSSLVPIQTRGTVYSLLYQRVSISTRPWDIVGSRALQPATSIDHEVTKDFLEKDTVFSSNLSRLLDICEVLTSQVSHWLNQNGERATCGLWLASFLVWQCSDFSWHH